MKYFALLLLLGCSSAPQPAPAAHPKSAAEDPSTSLRAGSGAPKVSPQPPPPPPSQNPSPMVEHTRAHERVTQKALSGRRFTIEGVLDKPVEVLVTPAAASSDRVDYLIHFHGSSWLPMQAAEESGRPYVVLAVNLGGGGNRYSSAFADPVVFEGLLRRAAETAAPHKAIYLTAFSAGYGAVREIVQQVPDRIDGVLLLDGLHTSYVPDRKPIAEGGKLEESRLAPFLDYARRGKRLVITHSEIFPGTFASTTETTDWLVEQLGWKRTPVMKWGPLGMQQLSEVRNGNVTILGFAGNTAPDHVDHFHAIGTLLPMLTAP